MRLQLACTDSHSADTGYVVTKNGETDSIPVALHLAHESQLSLGTRAILPFERCLQLMPFA